jgi:hypothetical protein
MIQINIGMDLLILPELGDEGMDECDALQSVTWLLDVVGGDC